MSKKEKEQGTEPTCSLFIRNFPRSLKARFRALCELDGKHMLEVIPMLIREYVQKRGEARR